MPIAKLNTKLKIGIIGYQGKMGQEIYKVLQSKNVEIITDGGELNGDKKNIFINSDVIIDFSSTEGLSECLDLAVKFKKPLVSGSTPMTDELMQKILQASKQTKICWSANMSIGIAVVKKIASQTAKVLKEYDCEILEMHHNQKKDAPSGTAVAIGMAISQARKQNFDDISVFGRSGLSKRKENEIGFSSIRGGSIFGEHEIMFIGQNDKITISHQAFNRTLFAVGAVECAFQILKQKSNGLFTIEDLISIQ